ncbi:MAG: HPr family phosphocarrier protein [Chromatiales bacterium]|nr:HPr family phosphocarrier protein [Chromatiales bacterium]
MAAEGAAPVAAEFEIINRLGLHARAAAKLVRLAMKFEATIEITRNGRRVNAKSIMGVMMLAASCGGTVEVSADGHDADSALDAIGLLIDERFGEAA